MIAKNIVLIGMPGAGKSTLGILLAKQLGTDFVDTDILIQVDQGATLQEILELTDYLNLRRLEQQVLINLSGNGKVIATGGSAVYSEAGMQQLKANGTVIFLDLSLTTLTERVTDFDQRGIACRPDQSFADLFTERRPLYQQYADITIDCDHQTPAQTLAKIVGDLFPVQDSAID
ncbi:MAG: shikimate kinase [Porticoccaceae bacterium]